VRPIRELISQTVSIDTKVTWASSACEVPRQETCSFKGIEHDRVMIYRCERTYRYGVALHFTKAARSS
jgi:hypothetical protein